MITAQASSSESSEKVEKSSSSQKSEDESEKEDKSVSQFTINPALVPAYIPYRVIEKVGQVQQCMYMYCLFRSSVTAACVSFLVDSICWRGSENLPEKVRWRAKPFYHFDWCRYVHVRSQSG